MPDFIWVMPSSQYDDDIEPIQDPQCTSNQGPLTCPGPLSILFDGVLGDHYQMMKIYYNSTHGNDNSHPGLMLQCPLIHY